MPRAAGRDRPSYSAALLKRYKSRASKDRVTYQDLLVMFPPVAANRLENGGVLTCLRAGYIDALEVALRRVHYAANLAHTSNSHREMNKLI